MALLHQLPRCRDCMRATQVDAQPFWGKPGALSSPFSLKEISRTYLKGEKGNVLLQSAAFQPHPKRKRLGNTSAHHSWGWWMTVINHSDVERPSSSPACHYISTAVSRAGILDMNLRAYSCSISKQHTTPSVRKDVPTHKEKQVWRKEGNIRG